MSDDQTDRLLRVPRIVLGAMMLGIVAFAGVSPVLRGQGLLPASPELVPILYVVLAAVIVGAVTGCLVVRRTLIGGLRRKWAGRSVSDIPPAERARALISLTIVSAALAEGAALTAIVVFLLGANWAVLAVPALALFRLVSLMPTGDRVDRLVEQATSSGWR